MCNSADFWATALCVVPKRRARHLVWMGELRRALTKSLDVQVRNSPRGRACAPEGLLRGVQVAVQLPAADVLAVRQPFAFFGS